MLVHFLFYGNYAVVLKQLLVRPALGKYGGICVLSVGGLMHTRQFSAAYNSALL